MAWTNTAITKQKITKALIDEIQAAVDKATPRRGTSTTAGTGGQTITLSPAETSTNYDVSITLTGDPGGDVGAIWVDPADKATGSFKVRNIGATGKSFQWTLTRY